MKLRVLASAVATSAMILTVGLAQPAVSATHHTKHFPHYKNCTQLNRDYKHGVGLPKAKDKHGKSSKAVTNFKKSKKLYKANDGKAKRSKWERDLDRDNDGIACEKR